MMNLKKSFLCLALILGPARLLTAAEIAPNPAQSAYDQAVQSYVEAATTEMAAIRGQADGALGATPEAPVKQRFAKVYSQLDECDKLLAELKKADQASFDLIKARFEKARAAALKSLDDAQRRK